MKALLRVFAWAGMIVFAAGPATASPIVISYIATDLADTVPGEDRWEYRYFVEDFAFLADQGFAIDFDPSLYEDLGDPPPAVSVDWDVITFQPDTILGSPGLYDALALVAGASLTDPFVVAFTWLGGPMQAPGSQPFTVYAPNSSGMLSELESGTTVPFRQTIPMPVPEPATAVLIAFGAAAAYRSRRARREWS